MSKNKLEIKKVRLREFIETLMEIYESGIDYVNILVEKGNHQDSIWIVGDIDDEQKHTKINGENINFEELT